MNYKLALKHYLFSYIALFVVILLYSIINLFGFYNSAINGYILFAVINIFYLLLGHYLRRLKFNNVLLYGLPILFLNSFISVIISFSIHGILFVIINYLFITLGAKISLKKASH